MTDRTKGLSPVPKDGTRLGIARRVREEAACLSFERGSSAAVSNNGETTAALGGPKKTPEGEDEWIAAFGTFTKGLEHDEYGRVRRGDLRQLVSEINQDAPGSGPEETPLPGTYANGVAAAFNVPKYNHDGAIPVPFAWPENSKGTSRNWESPLAGHAFELEGADPGQIGIPPAPALGSAELAAEIAEVYEMAMVRDVAFADWGKAGSVIDTAATALAALPFFMTEDGLTDAAKRRRMARAAPGAAVGPVALTHDTLFRGSTSGAMAGPYVSQFLLIGTADRSAAAPAPSPGPSAIPASQDALNRSAVVAPLELLAARGGTGNGGGSKAGSAGGVPESLVKGFIQYGAQTIPQFFTPHAEEVDHMTDWASWRDVQNGSNRKNFDLFLRDDATGETCSRFILTPRDLATYVHFDQLYQAYLNACLILLGMEAPTDAGLPEGGKHPTRDGFALYGGPHVLTLVCEVATRALKAVRRQKYNVHLRGRPEAVAAAIALAWNAQGNQVKTDALGGHAEALTRTFEAADGTAGPLSGTLVRVSTHNAKQNAGTAPPYFSLGPLGAARNGLLPMAFPEGSPMHPSYGAGHATVAGACVTVLKAFFEMFTVTGGALFEGGEVRHGLLDVKEVMANRTKVRDTLFDDELKLTGPGGVGSRSGPEGFDLPVYEADPDPYPDGMNPPNTMKRGTRLKEVPGPDVTVQGELDKLGANIAIGRDFAGVHYYADYYESYRMGERIAVSILQEQMLTYREPVSMRFTSFDGDKVMLVGTGGSRGLDDAPVLIWNKGGTAIELADWWRRHIA